MPKDMRVANALGEIGPSVMLGAATTFLGIMPMAFAQNAIFRVFFKMFLVIITFGVRAGRFSTRGVAFVAIACRGRMDMRERTLPHSTTGDRLVH